MSAKIWWWQNVGQDGNGRTDNRMWMYRSYLKKKKNKSDKLKIYALDFILMITELLQKLQVFFSAGFCDTVYSNLHHSDFFMDPR